MSNLATIHSISKDLGLTKNFPTGKMVKSNAFQMVKQGVGHLNTFLNAQDAKHGTRPMAGPMAARPMAARPMAARPPPPRPLMNLNKPLPKLPPRPQQPKPIAKLPPPPKPMAKLPPKPISKKIPSFKTPKYGKNYVSPYKQKK